MRRYWRSSSFRESWRLENKLAQQPEKTKVKTMRVTHCNDHEVKEAAVSVKATILSRSLPAKAMTVEKSSKQAEALSSSEQAVRKVAPSRLKYFD